MMSAGTKRKEINNLSNDVNSSDLDTDSLPKRFKLRAEDCKEWGLDSVVDYLREHEISSDVINAFHDHNIRGRVLEYITEDRLKQMGIERVGDRIEVLKALEPFQKKPNPRMKPFQDIADTFKVFNDPIHGHIEVHPLCVAIIDTPQFQRLRFIKQLGGCYYVFPGATNNRFEHSIGVSHLAGQLARALRDRQPELDITDRDILCVEIAGLCHDLGHGPFSHMFDGQFIPLARPNDDWAHEDASKMMFDYMLEVNDLKPKFEEFGLNAEDLAFIKEQIHEPKKNYKARGKEKRFLYEIVANKRNGIDVDKWDYFARDCHSLGINNNFDHLRFMKFARVITVEKEKQICSRDKEVGNVYDMFATRAMLHRQVYQHKVKGIIEHMITEAFLKADKHLKIPGVNGEMRSMSEAVYDPVAFTKLTDNVFHQILYSTSEELRESREILQRIERRDIYRCIGQSRPSTHKEGQFSRKDKPILAAEIVEGSNLSPDDIVIQIVSLDFGMKEKNPIDHVRFYKKSSPEQAIQIPREDVSHMLPDSFREQLIRVFVKKSDEESFNTAKECFKQWCLTKEMKPSQVCIYLWDLEQLERSGANTPVMGQTLNTAIKCADCGRSPFLENGAGDAARLRVSPYNSPCASPRASRRCVSPRPNLSPRP